MDEDRVEGSSGRHAANDRLETKGAIGEGRAAVEDSYARARGRVRALLDNAPAAAREAVATGRHYYRRGADIVTRNAADSTTMSLFAAGVAVAAVSWLILGQGRGKTRGEDKG